MEKFSAQGCAREAQEENTKNAKEGDAKNAKAGGGRKTNCECPVTWEVRHPAAGEAVGLRQEEGWTDQRAAVQEGAASTAVAGAVCGRGVNAEKGPDPNADCLKILAGFSNDWKNLSRVFQRLEKFFTGTKILLRGLSP